MSTNLSKAQRLKNIEKIRARAEEDLFFFAKLMNPMRLYGEVHEELFEWWNRPIRKKNMLALLPRGHQKSHCAAVKVAWDIVRNPSISILYISATSQLAEAQLFAIKQIMTSEMFQLLWPEIINEEESKRARWTTGEIIVDHPNRALEGIRDYTVAARGVTSNITGLHADAIYLDDLVVPANAYTQEGRDKVEAAYSQLASIKNPGAEIIVVGTRYHPKDLYDTLMNLTYNLIDEETQEYVGKDRVYDLLERKVEEEGVFLWPKGLRNDGKSFGFDLLELERIKAEYVDTAQFHAQYYNNPNDPENAKIGRDRFQYYDRKYIKNENGVWFYKDKKLNVYAAVDFAFSLRNKADYSAIVVVGVTSEHNIYILDIERFKTDKIAIYFERILAMHQKWGFRKIRAEVNVGQTPIVRELREEYIKRNGITLSVDEYRPNRHEGTKEERISAALEPKYHNLAIWHYKGGNCSLLEEELILSKPPHDDIKDALAAVMDIIIAPKVSSNKEKQKNNIIFSNRFGGVKFRNDW
jgi:hypothetical protein